MITEQMVKEVVSFVESKGLSEMLIADLKSQFQDFHFTYCMDDDMGAYEPSVEANGFNIYFVDSSNHCATLTRSPDNASGMVLAEVIE